MIHNENVNDFQISWFTGILYSSVFQYLTFFALTINLYTSVYFVDQLLAFEQCEFSVHFERVDKFLFFLQIFRNRMWQFRSHCTDLCVFILVTVMHASLRMRNVNNKISRFKEYVGLKRTPMGVILEALGQEQEAGS